MLTAPESKKVVYKTSTNAISTTIQIDPTFNMITRIDRSCDNKEV